MQLMNEYMFFTLVLFMLCYRWHTIGSHRSFHNTNTESSIHLKTILFYYLFLFENNIESNIISTVNGFQSLTHLTSKQKHFIQQIIEKSEESTLTTDTSSHAAYIQLKCL